MATSNKMTDKSDDYRKSPPLYSEKLLGLKTECNIGGCRQWETSTGWITYNARMNQWYVEFQCADHGKSSAWHIEWQPLIDEIIEAVIEEGSQRPVC